MNDDALAAVVAAAQMILARSAGAPAAPAISRWNLAARVGFADAARLRRIAAADSRWAASGRLRE